MQIFSPDDKLRMNYHDLPPDQRELVDLAQARMPFGKYRGRLLLDLPEPYLVWFSGKGFPQGPLGRQLRQMHELATNGLKGLLEPLRDKSRA